MWSPSQPHRNEPSTVPVRPNSGSSATGQSPPGFSADFSPYSLPIPGATNDSEIGFIASIVTAVVITTTRPMCARRNGASCAARTRTSPDRRDAASPRGTSPYAVAARPRTISTMPMVIGASISMPRMW